MADGADQILLGFIRPSPFPRDPGMRAYYRSTVRGPSLWVPKSVLPCRVVQIPKWLPGEKETMGIFFFFLHALSLHPTPTPTPLSVLHSSGFVMVRLSGY